MRVWIDGIPLTVGEPSKLWINRLTGKLSASPFWMLRGILYRPLHYQVTVKADNALLEISTPIPVKGNYVVYWEADGFWREH